MEISVLFIIFNRPAYTKKSFAAIRKAKPSKLYIAADGPRDCASEKELCEETREFVLNSVDWECEVKTLFQKKNLGCGLGVSSGISWFFEHEKCGIIIEDDVVVNYSFFKMCSELLEKYRNDKKIWSIGGYNLQGTSTFKESYSFTKSFRCWGWATWKDRWEYFSLDVSNLKENILDYYTKDVGVKQHYQEILWKLQNEKDIPVCRIDTWDCHYFLVCIRHKVLHIIPQKNMVKNIGLSGVHINCKRNPLLNTKVYKLDIVKYPKSVKGNQKLQDQIDKMFIKFTKYPKIPVIKDRKIYLWGTGVFALKVLFLTRMYEITAFLDKSQMLDCYGYKVKHPEEILNRTEQNRTEQNIFIFIASTKYVDEMTKTCKRYGLKKGVDFWSPI